MIPEHFFSQTALMQVGMSEGNLLAIFICLVFLGIWLYVRVTEDRAPQNLPAVIPGNQITQIGTPETSSSTRIQLKLKRSQRTRGIFVRVIFVLDARMEIPAAEMDLINRYELKKLVIYNSSARRQHQMATMAHLESTRDQPSLFDAPGEQAKAAAKTLFRLARAAHSAARARMALRVTVASLSRGVHIECRSMDELMGAENAIVQAAQNLRSYLDTAATFDGREEVLEF